jgi:hypothetical protein
MIGHSMFGEARIVHTSNFTFVTERVRMRFSKRLLYLIFASLQIALAFSASHIQAAPFLNKSDTMVQYFDKTTSTNGVSFAAFTYDAGTDSFWTLCFGSGQSIRNVAWNGTNWVPSGTGVGAANGGYVSDTSWFLYKRADNTQGTSSPNENTGWGGGQATPGGILLNPAPLTIAGQTYAAGTLALITDGATVVSENPGNITRLNFTKALYWYNLTETGTSTPSGAGAAPGPSTDYNGNNIVGWNDQFTTVLTRANLLTADGDSGSATASNLARSGAFSSNGQSFYMLDSNTTLGGIYKVDLTTTGAVTKILDADSSSPTSNLINTEMAVVPTSTRNFGFAGAGDQIIVEGSAGLGNNGGLNAYLDDGTTFNTTAKTVFTSAQFDAFLDVPTPGGNRYQSVVADAQGNLYFNNATTDGIYMYDTQGRFLKVSSYQERRAFQKSFGIDNPNATTNDFQLRTNTTAEAFPVTELLYTDAAFDAPIGILVYKPGDFDRDNDVDATDKSQFLAALRARGVAAPNLANARFNLNGNVSTTVTTSVGSQIGNPGTEAIFNPIVDWKDVKILQTFLDFPDGDTNLDGVLNITDLNTMRDNYYTLMGAANKTWAQGDFASLNPHASTYSALAIDANLVNLVDLNLLADTWQVHPEFAQLTWADLNLNGYTGQFRLDVIAAFDLQEAPIPEPGTCCLLLLGCAFLARRRSHRQALAARRIDR